MTFIDRILARTGDDEASTRLSKIRAYEIILILGLVSEWWRYAIPEWTSQESPGVGLLVRPSLATALAVAGLLARRRRAAMLGLLLLQMTWVIEMFPLTANHTYLLALLLGLGCVCDFDREEDQTLWLESTRWIFLVVFFYAGIQKLVHGFYFGGEYFAYYLDREPFALALQPFLSTSEFVHFTSEIQYVDGAGPFRFKGPLVVALSNAGYLVEITVPILLMFRRTRLLAVSAATVFLIFTEAMAREFHFGLIFFNGLLLFLPSDTNRRLLPFFGAFYVWMLGMTFGLIPGVTFS